MSTQEITVDYVRGRIQFIRVNDCDFLTVETVEAYSRCTFPQAVVALAEEMGETWCRAGTSPILEPRDVIYDRELYSIERGRRWTKVARVMSNGQRTAWMFVDEQAEEVREAKSWKVPKSYWLTGPARALVLSIVARADGGVTC